MVAIDNLIVPDINQLDLALELKEVQSMLHILQIMHSQVAFISWLQNNNNKSYIKKITSNIKIWTTVP